MKNLTTLHQKSGLRFLLLIILGIAFLLAPPPQAARAQSPDLEFEANSYVAASGEATILSQQLQLDQAYFEAAGTLDGLRAAADGLGLADGLEQGTYISGAIRSPLDFTTDISLAWLADVPDTSAVGIEMRLGEDGQTWGDWQPVPVEYYPIRDNEYSGTLVWVDQAEVYAQIKITLTAEGEAKPTLQHLTLFFNDTSSGPTTEVAAASVAAQENDLLCPAQPPVIARSEWGCPPGQDSPAWPPAYEPVTHIVINHTATPNSAGDWARVVRSIWHYHANTLGWGDIGYNYLVDPLGNIYEGRAGGDDAIGAFDGFNRGAMGIGYIGCYGDCDPLGLTNADPTAAMLDAGNDLIAWTVHQKGLDPFGEGAYCEQTLPTIVGRSDVTCRSVSVSPGSWLAERIPEMRLGVEERLDVCTPEPSVRVAPASQAVGLGATGSTTIEAVNVTNLFAVELELTYNAFITEVADADPDQAGTQIGLGPFFEANGFFVAQNEAGDGLITFSATRKGPATGFDGTIALVDITWQGQLPGETPLTLGHVRLVDAAGQEIAATPQDGTLTVESGVVIRGHVELQGRTDHSGVIMTMGEQTAETGPDGQFMLPVEPGERYFMTMVMPGYLNAEADRTVPINVDAVDLGTITLPGGDVTDDDVINIFDLAYIGSHYHSNDPLADLTADGLVDILDLSLAATNYGQQGPLIIGLDEQLRAALTAAGVTPFIPDVDPDPDQAELGRLLFFDKILSGNRDTSCSTCHLMTQHTSDGLSISIGTGSEGLGPGRIMGPNRNLHPRNSPDLFNRGVSAFETMFWDSRVAGSHATGFVSPAGDQLPPAAEFDSLLAVLAMFPATARDEMRGLLIDPADNELAPFDDEDFTGIWAALMARLVAIPDYEQMFKEVYPDVPTDELGFHHAANAIAAFISAAFVSNDSPFDRYVEGDDAALSQAEKLGALIFFEEANCVQCHSGPLFTDQEHHNIGVPQIGPGQPGEEPLDSGRFRETDNPAERFAFRTPPLRNVALTGPWLHSGAYTTLEGVIRQHLQPEAALRGYDVNQLRPDLREFVQDEEATLNDILATLDPTVEELPDLTDEQVARLVDFLEALTDPASVDLNGMAPTEVPSGLPVDK